MASIGVEGSEVIAELNEKPIEKGIHVDFVSEIVSYSLTLSLICW